MEPRRRLVAELERYRDRHGTDSTVERFMTFVAGHPQALDRSTVTGHVTASAWVVDPAAQAAVLIRHPKLERWLQPGGHIEAGETTVEASLREAREETGLVDVFVASERVFDLDIHEIPARGSESAHLHYDVRHLLYARRTDEPRANAEVSQVEWVDWDRLATRTTEWSVLRLAVRCAQTYDGELP